MSKKGEAPEPTTPGPQAGRETDTNHLRFYDTTNTRALQASVYPPGWLIARMKQPPPANPITRRQGLALLNLIRGMGLEKYRGYKARLSIPLDLPLHRLTKAQAWQLIHHITQDLEAQDAINS